MIFKIRLTNNDMTTEELFTDRYKVIAPYPHSPYEVGDIITMPENGGSFHLTTIHYTDEFGDRTASQIWQAPAEILRYPHLFRKLDWHEERELEDMPTYVKCIKTPDQIIQPGEVLKVIWNKNGGKVENGPFVFPYTNCYIPATKEEYETFINKQQP